MDLKIFVYVLTLVICFVLAFFVFAILFLAVDLFTKGMIP